MLVKRIQRERVVSKSQSLVLPQKDSQQDDDKFQTYYDFDQAVNRLRDHQVLAIRRGVDKKALKLAFDIDNDRAESMVYSSLSHATGHKLWKDAIHNAWSRLLRRKCTTRAWKQACDKAEQRAIMVFCDNTRKALLAPPARPPTAVLALDPGFKAGIKTAILDANGKPVGALQTVKFMGNQYETGKEQLVGLLNELGKLENSKDKKLVAALGNGHGSQEARQLLNEASSACNVPVDIKLVNEAGASVWSVTEAASREFPNEPPSAIAAVSIARRYQDPLPELVKIPPRSLGLGMYQHDFTEKVLDDKLHATSVDAVAEVGVDANSCSIEILEKVPGMTKTLSERIIKARPLKGRHDLLNVSGLGPKTFENCAAFIRVSGNDFLDRTMVHPESYDLARYLLKKLQWDVDEPSSLGTIPPENERKIVWQDVIGKASKRFDVTEERVLLVLHHLIRSIANPDPRLDDNVSSATGPSAQIGSADGCTPLPSRLLPLDELRKACPVRRVTATIRNVVDFGCFVDFGAENDGLVHRSKVGPVMLDSLLVGQEIGVDILGVSASNRVTVSLTGLDLPPESQDSLRDDKKKRSNGGSQAAQRKRQRAGKK